MLLDLFHGSDESAEEYEHDPDDPNNMFQDPLRAGMAGDKPILDPRRYFLDTLEVRIKRVTNEWRLVRDTLNEDISLTVTNYPFLNF